MCGVRAQGAVAQIRVRAQGQEAGQPRRNLTRLPTIMITESNVDTGKPDEAEHDAPAKMMDVLRNSNFVKLWTAQILSQTAQQIVNFALLLQVARITASSTAVSGIIICFTIP